MIWCCREILLCLMLQLVWHCNRWILHNFDFGDTHEYVCTELCLPANVDIIIIPAWCMASLHINVLQVSAISMLTTVKDQMNVLQLWTVGVWLRSEFRVKRVAGFRARDQEQDKGRGSMRVSSNWRMCTFVQISVQNPVHSPVNRESRFALTHHEQSLPNTGCIAPLTYGSTDGGEWSSLW